MERKELEAKGLTAEQIDFVLAENGKDVQREQSKVKTAVDEAVKPLNEQIGTLTKQAEEYQETIKKSSGVDETAKKEIGELQKTHATALKEMQNKHDAELAKLKREAETREFFSGLSKKFITPETQKAFEQRLNEALTDKAYEGKNRADILAVLVKGEDGKERADIYATEQTAKPGALGGTNPPPGNGDKPGETKAPPKII